MRTPARSLGSIMERPERPTFPSVGRAVATAPRSSRSKSTRSSKTAQPIAQFEAAAQQYLEHWAELFPHEASDLGLHQFDALLGRNDPRTHQLHIALLKTSLRAVEALPDNAFAGDDWLDRRGFLSLLRTRLFE